MNKHEEKQTKKKKKISSMKSEEGIMKETFANNNATTSKASEGKLKNKVKGSTTTRPTEVDYGCKKKDVDIQGDRILGQLKASEARNRVRALRRQYHGNRATEISHLISTQPTAIKAVRLQSLLPPIPTKIKFKDTVIKEQRMRIEALMEDDLGIETGRILC